MSRSPLLSGLMLSAGVALIGTLLASLLMLGTGLSENSWLAVTLIIHGLALTAGGFVTGKRSESKGWYRGGLLGIMYTFVVWLIGFLAYDSSITRELMMIAGLALAAGAFGGMVGVNVKK
ncbi:putative membrane protein, TIGR04086 family [Paenibacillus sp. UNCCL117]|uniref:TIGR04086 family membrane protein n=1 Tax=unclassified Paenibacillus TaxID=185978 RepID=UPI00088AFAD7|nr:MULTISPECIES: TIGR04086 family membrane protein [unclassified Paenibacillus]SDE60133.1 putative membrane protein, TIGR04086 family [Paenibacillus sp. cl123]SFW69456.1 putative membrane protein, TIGR04086 family [Paenibacillus sp. UNCCL117]